MAHAQGPRDGELVGQREVDLEHRPSGAERGPVDAVVDARREHRARSAAGRARARRDGRRSTPSPPGRSGRPPARRPGRTPRRRCRTRRRTDERSATAAIAGWRRAGRRGRRGRRRAAAGRRPRRATAPVPQPARTRTCRPGGRSRAARLRSGCSATPRWPAARRGRARRRGRRRRARSRRWRRWRRDDAVRARARRGCGRSPRRPGRGTRASAAAAIGACVKKIARQSSELRQHAAERRSDGRADGGGRRPTRPGPRGRTAELGEHRERAGEQERRADALRGRGRRAGTGSEVASAGGERRQREQPEAGGDERQRVAADGAPARRGWRRWRPRARTSSAPTRRPRSWCRTRRRDRAARGRPPRRRRRPGRPATVSSRARTRRARRAGTPVAVRSLVSARVSDSGTTAATGRVWGGGRPRSGGASVAIARTKRYCWPACSRPRPEGSGQVVLVRERRRRASARPRSARRTRWRGRTQQRAFVGESSNACRRSSRAGRRTWPRGRRPRTSAARKRAAGICVVPAGTVTAVRPPGMNRAITTSPTPRVGSRRRAHASLATAFSPVKRRSIQGRARCRAVADVVAADGAGPARRSARRSEVARRRHDAGDDHRRLARDEREHRVGSAKANMTTYVQPTHRRRG